MKTNRPSEQKVIQAAVDPSAEDKQAGGLVVQEQEPRRTFDQMLEFLFLCNLEENQEETEDEGNPLEESLDDQEVQGDKLKKHFDGMIDVLIQRSSLKERAEENATIPDESDSDTFAGSEHTEDEGESDTVQSLSDALSECNIEQQKEKSGAAVGQNDSASDESRHSEHEEHVQVTPGPSSEDSFILKERPPMTAEQVAYFDRKITEMEACVKFAPTRRGDSVATNVADNAQIDMYHVFMKRLSKLRRAYKKASDMLDTLKSWSDDDKIDLLIQLSNAEFYRMTVSHELIIYDMAKV